MGKKRVGVLISGSGTNLQALIDAAKNPSFPAEIVLVISNIENAFGLSRAREAGIETKYISHKNYDGREAFDAALDTALKDAGVEIVCLAGFMRLLTPNFVQKWHGRMINIHPSLLPSFKGHHAQEDAVAAGVKLVGCTVHFVVPEMDSGAIIAQGAVAIGDDDTAANIRVRVLKAEHACYVYALKQLALGTIRIEDNTARILGRKLPDTMLLSFVE